VLGDHADQVVQHLLGSALAEVVLLRERGDQILLDERLAGIGFSGCCCCRGILAP
jgi:hypothetical protein